jgi:Ca-activated chloride channel family protein
MKKNNIGKYAKSYISLFIAGLMMLTACGQAADVPDEPEVTYTHEEIEDRIRHVGRRYDGLDNGYGLNVFGTGGYSTANS